MDIVIRPVNDRFLEDVVFPAFEAGMEDGRAALERLQGAVADERVRTLAELLQDRSNGPLRELADSDEWTELIYRLLFWEWLASDRKSTRLNSSHVEISYAVFCLKKKK